MLFELHCLLLHSYDKESAPNSWASWEAHVEQMMHEAIDSVEYREYLYRYTVNVRNGLVLDGKFYGVPASCTEFQKMLASTFGLPLARYYLFLEDPKEMSAE